MKARQLLERTGPLFSTETMAAVSKAFDSAWALIAVRYTGDASAIDQARLRLAECVLAVTKDGDRSAEQIARLALQMFRLIDEKPPEVVLR
jgi:hypothetical protein